MYLDFNNIGPRELARMEAALKSGYVSTAAPQVAEFERAMAEYLGVGDCVATNSGTAALHLALLGISDRLKDEVVMPVLTFVATANVARYMGKKPVLVDVSRETWCVEEGEIENAVNFNTHAIIGVNLYGSPCDWFNIEDVAHRHGSWLIEDACESLGCKQKYGVLTDFQCYSFNGNKTMTTGGGGLLVAQKGPKARLFRGFSQQAKVPDGTHAVVGYNYRMTGLSAALGLAQLERLSGLLKRKKDMAAQYAAELGHLVEFQKTYPSAESSYWMTAVLFPEDIDIPALQEKLMVKGIPTRRIFRPLTDSAPYREANAREKYPNAYYIYDHGICLPSSTLNTEKDIDTVCKELKEAL